MSGGQFPSDAAQPPVPPPGPSPVVHSPPVPAPPPARPRLRRLVLPSVFALGGGAVDAIFYVHFANIIRNLGGGWFVGLGSLAAGAAASLVIAPLAAAVSDIKLGGRKPLTLVFNLVSLMAAASVAIVYGTAPGVAGERDLPAHYISVACLGAVYRALTLSSPSVPTLIETSLHGDPEGFPARRDAALSFFYIWTRLGLAAGLAAIYSLSGRNRPMWFQLVAAIVGIITLATSSGLVHRPPAKAPLPPGSPPRPPPPSVFRKVVSDQKSALFNTPKGVHKLYVTCFFYGIAYGQLAAITGPYYSSVIFGEAAGTSRVVRWTGLASGLNLIIGIIIDGLTPSVAKVIGPRASRWLWPSSLLLGSGLFVGLALTSVAKVAVSMLSLQGITIGAHSFFSLVGAGALVHPSLRATTFGARLASQILGNLIGAVVAGVLASRRDEGFRDVMTVSAAMSVIAALAALAVGEFPPLERAKGVATNANVLVSYAFRRHHRAGWKDGKSRGPAAAGAGHDGQAGDRDVGGDSSGSYDGQGDGNGHRDGDVEIGESRAALKARSLTKRLGTDPEWQMAYWKDDEKWYDDEALAELAVPELSPLTPTPSGVFGGGDRGGQPDYPGAPGGAATNIHNFASGWK
ncbi:hypothetical protein MMPV_003222 [Pyropia vietnamensis]